MGGLFAGGRSLFLVLFVERSIVLSCASRVFFFFSATQRQKRSGLFCFVLLFFFCFLEVVLAFGGVALGREGGGGGSANRSEDSFRCKCSLIFLFFGRKQWGGV